MPNFTIAGFGKSITDLIAGATGTTTSVTVLNVDGSQTTISAETAKAVLAARSAEAIAKKEKERVEALLKAELGESTMEILVDRQVVFTWIPQVKTVLDTARLKAEAPAIFEAYSKQQTSRPLLSKPKIVAALFG